MIGMKGPLYISPGTDITRQVPEWMNKQTVGDLTTLSCKHCTGFVTLREGQELPGWNGQALMPPLLHDSWCIRLKRLKAVK